ncbi:hypothetical protein ACPF04_10510 [Campylobacter sp. MOP51]|uniref:hypothetical protein n=1 Tax=Campylobacter canis TaxID=3378588 RepID=UPI003C58E387
MNNETYLVVLILTFVVTFFMALIKPKGIRKLLWLFIWFMVFYGEGFIVSYFSKHHIYQHAKINIYDHNLSENIQSIFLGNHTLCSDNEQYTNIYNLAPEIGEYILMEKYVKFIEYQEVSDNKENNCKYFRVYVDNNTSENCFTKNMFGLYSYERISDQGLCFARKEISKDDVSPIELMVKNSKNTMPEPDVKPSILAILLGAKFHYNAIIKDRKTNKTLANSIYATVGHQGIAEESHIRASGNSRGYICNQMRLRLEDCDKELIKEFFRKDNK